MSAVPQERGAHVGFSALRDQAFWRRIPGAGAVLTLSLLAATLLATTAHSFWLGDLAVHFPVQYAALALIAFAVFLVWRRPGWAALALAVAAFNAMSAAPVLAARPPAAPAHAPGATHEDDPVHVRVASINVLYSNREYGRVADFIHRERPDAVVLVEMNPGWRAALAGIEREFPYRYETLGTRRGVDLWSRLPLSDAGVLPIDARQEPAIQATLRTPQGRSLRLFGVHTSWPMTPPWAARRNHELTLLAQKAQGVHGLPLVIVGDLNVSPFSPHFRQLLADGRLRSAADGFGWQPTWPSFLLPAGIQIDHALVSGDVSVQSFRRGGGDGSDHRPIVVDLLL